MRLGLLLEQIFPEARIQMVSTQINPAAVARAGEFGRSDEYIYFAKFGEAGPVRTSSVENGFLQKGALTMWLLGGILLRRSGKKGSGRKDSPGGFYPIYVDPSGPKIVKVGDPFPKAYQIQKKWTVRVPCCQSERMVLKAGGNGGRPH